MPLPDSSKPGVKKMLTYVGLSKKIKQLYGMAVVDDREFNAILKRAKDDIVALRESRTSKPVADTVTRK